MTLDNDVMTSQYRRMAKRVTKLEGVWDDGQGIASRKLTKAQAHTLSLCNAAAQERLRDMRYELLTELHADGWTLRELGALLGCSKQRVAVMMRAR